MDAQAQFTITVDGRSVVAQPRPEDQATIDELLRRGANVTIAQTDADTEGHTLAGDEIFVDVEGHAMTLRLPTAGDAVALRRALAVGALTATVAIGGFAAGSFAQSQSLAQQEAVTTTQLRVTPTDQEHSTYVAPARVTPTDQEHSTISVPPAPAAEAPQPPQQDRHGSRPE